MKQAMFWEGIGNDRVLCLLCPQKCVIADGKRGFCRVRHNDREYYILLITARFHHTVLTL